MHQKNETQKRRYKKHASKALGAPEITSENEQGDLQPELDEEHQSDIFGEGSSNSGFHQKEVISMHKKLGAAKETTLP